jgi:hypothetical protein
MELVLLPVEIAAFCAVQCPVRQVLLLVFLFRLTLPTGFLCKKTIWIWWKIGTRKSVDGIGKCLEFQLVQKEMDERENMEGIPKFI